jgi:ATP-dependent RNA helicase DDX27
MELKKGQNLLEHGDEIYSRPARTWFQSEKEKQQVKGTQIRGCFWCLTAHLYTAVSKKQYESGMSSKTSENKQDPQEGNKVCHGFLPSI